MTTPPDDETGLREAFAALRREDAATAPPFARVLAGRVVHRRFLAPLLGRLVAAASLAAAVVVAVAVRRPAPPPAALSIEPWTAPTDFLLQTPGLELLETVPRIGAPDALAVSGGAARNETPPR